MDKDILGFDFPTKTIGVEDFVNIIKSTDNSQIMTDFRISNYLKGVFSFRPEFFQSHDGVKTPYRFVHAPLDYVSCGEEDRSGLHSVAGVVEAYPVGEDARVESLDDVKNIVLLSFFTPVLFEVKGGGLQNYYNELLLKSIDYEKMFEGNMVCEDSIRDIIETKLDIILPFEIAVSKGYIFAAFDPTKGYEEQRERAAKFFSEIRKEKNCIAGYSVYNSSSGNKSLPDIMKTTGIKITTPRETEKAIESVSK